MPMKLIHSGPLCGAAFLACCAFAACSETSSAPQVSGDGGESVGRGQGGEPQAGGAGAGAVPGGSASSGSLNGGDAGESEGGSAGAPPAGPYRAVMGTLCPVQSTVGVVQLAGFPAPYVQVALYDRPDPWIGPAELSTATCAFHHYTPVGCASCEAEQVCSLEGQCVPERRTVKDATLEVRTGGDERTYAADPTLGGIYSTVEIGDDTSSYAMSLRWGELAVELEAMPVAGAQLTDLAITTEGDSDLPGALDATWEPSGQLAFVRSRIPINHHAAGPTFTECAVPESAGGFHANADMINPLAVKTGLEFQGVEHVFVAAASTPAGCVEFRFGEQIFALPNN